MLAFRPLDGLECLSCTAAGLEGKSGDPNDLKPAADDLAAREDEGLADNRDGATGEEQNTHGGGDCEQAKAAEYPSPPRQADVGQRVADRLLGGPPAALVERITHREGDGDEAEDCEAEDCEECDSPRPVRQRR